MAKEKQILHKRRNMNGINNTKIFNRNINTNELRFFFSFKPSLLIRVRVRVSHILRVGEFLETTFLKDNLRLCIKVLKKGKVANLTQ